MRTFKSKLRKVVASRLTKKAANENRKDELKTALLKATATSINTNAGNPYDNYGVSYRPVFHLSGVTLTQEDENIIDDLVWHDEAVREYLYKIGVPAVTASESQDGAAIHFFLRESGTELIEKYISSHPELTEDEIDDIEDGTECPEELKKQAIDGMREWLNNKAVVMEVWFEVSGVEIEGDSTIICG